jgi:hypothetical protein
LAAQNGSQSYNNNIEKSCPAFTGQTAGGISIKHHVSDKYHP